MQPVAWCAWVRSADLQADALTRRAPPLQATADAAKPQLAANAATLAVLGLTSGDAVKG